MRRTYTITDLLDAMKEQGLPGSKMWVRKQEDRGKLVCPRLPNGRGDRVFTLKQLQEIVKAFSPGGSGIWRYKHD